MVYIPTGRELVDPFKTLEAAGIRAGMKVADFGCGTLGHYVFPAAEMVGPDGVVHAVDILKSVLAGVESRGKLEKVNNVRVLWGDIERKGGVSLESGTLDMVILANNLFMSKQKPGMLAECARVLRSGGRLVIVEWKPTGISFGPEKKDRVAEEEARKLAEDAGLSFESSFEPGKYHYGLCYSKR